MHDVEECCNVGIFFQIFYVDDSSFPYYDLLPHGSMNQLYSSLCPVH